MSETNHAVPNNGTLTFEGKADNILKTLNDILRNRYVRLNVQWSIADEPTQGYTCEMDSSALAKAATTIDYAVMNDQRRRALGTRG